jgi:hypothetical protein
MDRSSRSDATTSCSKRQAHALRGSRRGCLRLCSTTEPTRKYGKPCSDNDVREDHAFTSLPRRAKSARIFSLLVVVDEVVVAGRTNGAAGDVVETAGEPLHTRAGLDDEGRGFRGCRGRGAGNGERREFALPDLDAMRPIVDGRVERDLAVAVRVHVPEAMSFEPEISIALGNG